MNLKFKRNSRNLILIIVLSSCSFLGMSQGDTSTIKAQFALGINGPSSDGFVNDFESNSINFPTINLGLQYMLSNGLGAKLDLGFNRFSSANNTPEFKTNYTRINAQLVYSISRIVSFSNRIVPFVHAGPGVSIIKPLGNYGQNKTSYLNGMAGLEIHYGVSDRLSVYIDGAYIFGFGNDFNPISSGFGSFNGNLLTVTIGASISLSGCYYCGD